MIHCNYNSQGSLNWQFASYDTLIWQFASFDPPNWQFDNVVLNIENKISKASWQIQATVDLTVKAVLINF